MEQAAVGVGLLLSGVGFAIGVAGLLYVAVHVMGSPPPSFGPQGEWAYGGVASLVVAGWSFSKAATFYARRRRSVIRDEGGLTPDIRLGPEGFSFRMGSPRAESDSRAKTWTWSSGDVPIPLKALTITPEQVTAADAALASGAPLEAVCRSIAPEYAGLGDFEQALYRQALQAAVDAQQASVRTETRRDHGATV